MKRFIIAVLAIPMLLVGCGQTNHTLPPGDGAVEHPAHTPQTVHNAELPSWLSISSNDVSSITVQGWGPGAAGNFVKYPTSGTSPSLINTVIDGLSSDKAIKPYRTPISKGGGEWLELKMKNGATISFNNFPNEPKPPQYIVTYDDKSQGPPRSTMISDVSGNVTSVFNEINKGKLVRQKTN